MSAIGLKRIALGCKWSPEWWHFKLAEFMPPMAVFGTFAQATLKDTGVGYAITFTEPHKFETGRQQLRVLERALGGKVFLFKPDCPGAPSADTRANVVQSNSISFREAMIAEQKQKLGYCRGDYRK